jgi:hypothetical protein
VRYSEETEKTLSRVSCLVRKGRGAQSRNVMETGRRRREFIGRASSPVRARNAKRIRSLLIILFLVARADEESLPKVARKDVIQLVLVRSLE